MKIEREANNRMDIDGKKLCRGEQALAEKPNDERPIDRVTATIKNRLLSL